MANNAIMAGVVLVVIVLAAALFIYSRKSFVQDSNGNENPKLERI